MYSSGVSAEKGRYGAGLEVVNSLTPVDAAFPASQDGFKGYDNCIITAPKDFVKAKFALVPVKPKSSTRAV